MDQVAVEVPDPAPPPPPPPEEEAGANGKGGPAYGAEVPERYRLGRGPPPSLAKVLAQARPEYPGLAVAFVLMAASEAFGLLSPLLLADAYDAVVDPTLSRAAMRRQVAKTMGLVVGLHACGVAAGFLRGSLMATAGERVVARLRKQTFGQLLAQETAFFDAQKSGDLVSRLTADTGQMQVALGQSISEASVGLCKVVTCVVLMAVISDVLTGIVLASIVVLGVVSGPFMTVTATISKQYQDVLGAASGHATEALGAMNTVRAFVAEERVWKKYVALCGDPEDAAQGVGPGGWWPLPPAGRPQTTLRLGHLKGLVQSGFGSLVFGGLVLAMYLSLWQGFLLVIDGKITFGRFMAFQSYIFQIGFGVGGVARHVSAFFEAKGAGGRVFEVIEREPEFDLRGGAVPAKPLVGTVEFESVDFSYPTRPDTTVLRGFTLKVLANSTAALVGSSGAGKTTVVSLLQRLYDVDGGSIRIDGHDLRGLDAGQVGVVQQEPSLFGMTIRENISYGLGREVTDAEVAEVATQANAHGFISQFPEGYSTLVGERGIRLSGGQKQRIAIARALMLNPRVLLLDEATSALDAESEHLVQEALDNLMVGRTTVIVAHRLSTVRNADQIVVLDEKEKKVVDVGSHAALVERCATYRDLIEKQLQ